MSGGDQFGSIGIREEIEVQQIPYYIRIQLLSEIPEDGMSHDAVVELSDKYNDYGQFDVRQHV